MRNTAVDKLFGFWYVTREASGDKTVVGTVISLPSVHVSKQALRYLEAIQSEGLRNYRSRLLGPGATQLKKSSWPCAPFLPTGSRLFQEPLTPGNPEYPGTAYGRDYTIRSKRSEGHQLPVSLCTDATTKSLSSSLQKPGKPGFRKESMFQEPTEIGFGSHREVGNELANPTAPT